MSIEEVEEGKVEIPKNISEILDLERSLENNPSPRTMNMIEDLKSKLSLQELELLSHYEMIEVRKLMEKLKKL